MDHGGKRKPRSRPPPPARKQSLPSLESVLDEDDAFDEELSPSSVPSEGGLRRTTSERPQQLSANAERKAPPVHVQRGWPMVLPEAGEARGSDLPSLSKPHAPRAPSAPSTPSSTSSVSSPATGEEAAIPSVTVAPAPVGNSPERLQPSSKTPHRIEEAADSAREGDQQQSQQQQPAPIKRSRSRDSSPNRSGTDGGAISPPHRAPQTSSARPRPMFQIPGPPKSPAPGKLPRVPSGRQVMTSRLSPAQTPGEDNAQALREALEKLATAESQLEAEKTKSGAAIHSLQEEVEQLRTEKVVENGTDYGQEVVDLQAKVSELQAASRRCQALEKKLAAAEELAKLADEDAQSAREDITAVRQQLKEAHQKLKSSSMSSRVSKPDGDERCKALEAEISNLKEQVESLDGERSLVLADYDSISAEVDDLRAKKTEQGAENAELKVLMKGQEDELNAEKAVAKSAKQQVRDLESQLKQALLRQQEAEEKVNSLTQENAALSTQGSSTQTLQQQIAAKDADIQKLQTANASSADKLATMRGDLDKIKKDLEEERSTAQSLREELAAKEEEVMTMTEEVAELNQTMLAEAGHSKNLEAQALSLEKEKVNLAEQLKQLKPSGKSAPSSSSAAVASTPTASESEKSPGSADSTAPGDGKVQAEEQVLPVTPPLARATTGNLSVGEVTKNEEVDKTDITAHPTQPKAEPLSNKISPASIRSNTSSGSGTPPSVTPYSVHKKRFSMSRETTPETSPETPRKDDAPASDSVGDADASVQEKPFTSKQPHSFMRSNAPSGVAALAAVMSGVGSKVGPAKSGNTSVAKAVEGDNSSAVQSPAGGNTPRIGTTPNSSPLQPRRPAPTARPRARGQAPMPPLAKREAATAAAPPAENTGADVSADVSPTEPASAVPANLKTTPKSSPKPSPKIARKPPPGRSVPPPPKKVLPPAPQRKESFDEESAQVEDAVGNDEEEITRESQPSKSPLGDISGEFDAISPATMKKLGISAGRERVRLGAQGGLAGRRKPTRTHLRGAADSGDELSQSDAEPMADDSGTQSASESPLVSRAAMSAAASSALAAAAAAAVSGRPSAAAAAAATTEPAEGSADTEEEVSVPGVRMDRAATVSLGQPVSSSALPDRRRGPPGDVDTIEEGEEDGDGLRRLRAKTLAGGIDLPLGGFLPATGAGPMKPSDLKKNNNPVAKPARKPPAPTPPGRMPPPIPEAGGNGDSTSRPDSNSSSVVAVEVNGVAVDENDDQDPDVITETMNQTDSRYASDMEDEDSSDDAPTSAGEHGDNLTVTSPSASSAVSPQHTTDSDGVGAGASFSSFSRENRRSGLRTAMDWSVDEVSNWLHLMNLPEVGPIFTKFDVDGQKLLSLDGAKMKIMGVTNAVQVATLKKEIKTMKSQVEKMMKDEKKRLEREAKLEKKRREDEAKLAKRNSKRRR
ncbi:nucleolar protein dao-5-like isoform X2 [Sycon ciliatum]|uniref:nucleolar protein dao-5-like isoform X2 n=1 Tax=Sycon ciliatum TaxID=27933 RepID=UPI0031F6D7B5